MYRVRHNDAVEMKLGRVASSVALGFVALAGAGAIGYAIGNDHTPLETIHTGTIYETPNEGTAYANGFNYAFPVNVAWTDSNRAVHYGERPACLRLDHATRAVFATVRVAQTGGGTVVWVRC